MSREAKRSANPPPLLAGPPGMSREAKRSANLPLLVGGSA
jgi:hypothetical protein